MLTSESFGANAPDEVRKSVAAQILICVATSIAMAVGLCLGASPLLLISRTPSNLYPYELVYLTIISAGLPATAVYWMTATQLRAVGDSKTPLLIMMFTALLNVGRDFLFILGLKWDVRGAAIATILAQLVAGLLCWWIIRRKARNLLPHRESWQHNEPMIRNELRLGLPMGAQFAVISVGLIIVQYFVNSFGDAAVAAYTVGSRLQIMMESPPPSMGTAIATYVGQNLGAAALTASKKECCKAN